MDTDSEDLRPTVLLETALRNILQAREQLRFDFANHRTEIMYALGDAQTNIGRVLNMLAGCEENHPE